MPKYELKNESDQERILVGIGKVVPGASVFVDAETATRLKSDTGFFKSGWVIVCDPCDVKKLSSKKTVRLKKDKGLNNGD